MWIKIAEDKLRVCSECHQLCLKIADPYDGKYLDDAEEFGVCHDCVEEIAAAIPAEVYRKWGAQDRLTQEELDQIGP